MAGNPTPDLLFINRGQLPEQYAEKADDQARQIRRHVQKQTRWYNSDKSRRLVPKKRLLGPGSDDALDEQTKRAAPNDMIGKSLQLWKKLAPRPGRYHQTSEPYIPTNSLFSSVLGQGRVDPFAPQSTSAGSNVVHEMIDHGVHNFWPQLALSETGTGVTNAVLQTNIQSMQRSRLVHYAYIVAISGHYTHARGDNAQRNEVERMQFKYRRTLLDLLDRAVAAMEGPMPDEVLGALLILMVADPIGRLPPARDDKSRFESPLAKAQLLDSFGAQPFDIGHASAIAQLLGSRGENTDVGSNPGAIPGIRAIIEITDLLSATRSGSKPVYPMMQQQRNVVLSEEYVLDRTASSLRDKFATRFRSIEVLRYFPDLTRSILILSQTAVALDHYCRSGNAACKLVDLIAARNTTQYTLLSLPTERDRKGTLGQENALIPVYELIRISLLIFSNMVLFPLPVTSGVSLRLAQSLKSLLTHQKLVDASHSLWVGQRPAVLWALTLGGISEGLSTEERQWFRDHVALVCQWLKVDSFEDLTELLLGFIWIDRLMNDAAEVLWQDVITVSPGV